MALPDALGNISLQSRDIHYRYDGRNRLLSELSGKQETCYRYDLCGNCLEKYQGKSNEFGLLKQIKYYDDYGREIGWIDFTNHGYPDNHEVPHWHEMQWNAQYPIGGYKIDHRLDSNPPFEY